MKKVNRTENRLRKALTKLRQQTIEINNLRAKSRLVIEDSRESEEKYKAVFKSARDGILLLDNKGKILDVSEKISKLSGYNKRQLIGKNIKIFARVTSKKDFEKLFKNFEDRMSGRATPPYEIKLIKKNGQLADIEINAIALRKKGKIISDLAIIRDITERKRTEEVTEQKTEDLLLLSLLNNALNRSADLQKITNLLSRAVKRLFACDGVTVYLLSPDSKYLVIQKNNILMLRIRQIEKMLKFKIPTEIKIPVKKGNLYTAMLQKKRPQLVNDPVKIQNMIAEFTENNTLKKLVPRIYKLLKIGSVINIPLIYGGKAIGLIDISREEPFTKSELRRLEVITEHVTSILRHFETLAAMRESEKQYRTLFEKSPTSITLLDKAGVIIDCNKATERLTGYAKEELIGKPFDQLLTLDIKDLPKVKELYRMLSKGSELAPLELEIIRKGGDRRRINFVSSLLVRDDTVVGFQVITRDITKQKKAEETLRHSEEIYKTLVRTTPEAVTVVDVKGNITFASHRTLEIHNYASVDELLGRSAFELIAPEDRGRAMQNMQKTLKQGIVMDLEYTFLRKDGSRFVGELNTALIKDRKGKPAGFIATTRDITERKRTQNALGRREEEFRILFDNAIDAIFWADTKTGLITNCNKTAEILLERKKHEIIGFPQTKLHPPQKARYYADLFKKHIKQKGAFDDEAEIMTKSGQIKVVHITASTTEIGEKTIIQGTFRDITERKQTIDALKESEEKYKTITENINVGIYRNTMGLRGKFIEANPALVKMFGYNSKEEFFKLNVADLYQNPKDREKFNEKMLRDGFVRREELKLRKKAGTLFTGSVSAVAVRDEKGEVKYYDGIIEDITDRKLHEQELSHMATHDGLTGLPNRMLCHDRLTVAIMHAQRKRQKLAVMLLDLDRFKDINDTLGHNVGDELLKYVGNRLINFLRRADTIARMGGDEFMLLLPDLVQIEDATKIAQKILEAIRKPFLFDDHTLNITTSIGISIYPNDGEDTDILMKNADIAMYHAKEKGRNTYQHFTPIINNG